MTNLTPRRHGFAGKITPTQQGGGWVRGEENVTHANPRARRGRV